MALVTVQRSPTPSTSSSPCVSESGSGEDDRRSQPRRGAALLIQEQIGSPSQSQSASESVCSQQLQQSSSLTQPAADHAADHSQ
ncbi:hypothetical protein NQZ68_010528 [Dissostichus eleginoides]|nr:hypothetical protein NQZ68_010528 [Dissostichus eleginoides]